MERKVTELNISIADEAWLGQDFFGNEIGAFCSLSVVGLDGLRGIADDAGGCLPACEITVPPP